MRAHLREELNNSLKFKIATFEKKKKKERTSLFRVFCLFNGVTPLNPRDIAISHLALFKRPAYSTPDSFVLFCRTKRDCFVLAVCEKERTKNGRWWNGSGTEIINARLPTTPH